MAIYQKKRVCAKDYLIERKSLLLWIAIIIVIAAGLAFIFNKGKNLKSADEFVKELKAKKYTIESVEAVPKAKISWFSGSQKVIKCSNTELSVFEFSSEEEAIREANKVSKDGFQIKSPVRSVVNTQNDGAVPLVTYVSWSDNPHFYRSGKLIVLYCGTNLKVQYDLKLILGSQFAGFKWYVPGKKR